MKYARLVFPCSIISDTYCNLGDVVQTFAIDMLYQKMNIDKSDIINIGIDEIKTYDGEEVILPISACFGYSSLIRLLPLSSRIVPVFLSVHCIEPSYLEGKNKIFWTKYAPIGCRDEETVIRMRKRGYDAWLTGCITAILPERKQAPKEPRVFIVDVNKNVLKYIPSEILKYAEFETQDIEIDKKKDREKIIAEMEQKAKDLYRRYYEEATLVITSRLHSAAPCIAMGVPVIAVKNGYDERWGWIDKFIHLYTPDEYETIDWDPSPVMLGKLKRLITDNAIDMLERKKDIHEQLSQIHNFYMDRDRKKLTLPFYLKSYIFVQKHFTKFAEFTRRVLLKKFSVFSESK